MRKTLAVFWAAVFVLRVAGGEIVVTEKIDTIGDAAHPFKGTLKGTLLDKDNRASSKITFKSATSERDKKGTGVDYVNAQCWGIDAVNLCKYKKKNQMILINGRLESGQYDNYKGITIYTLKTIVNQGGIHYLPDQPDARFADVFFERNPAEREFYKKFASAYRKELKEKNKENEENESDSN